MEDENPVVKRRRRPRWRLVLVGMLLLVLLLITIIWTQRRQIAADFIDRELARRGVPATYEVKRIGFSRQQLENLVIGDPARPDLTARFVEVKIRHTLLGPKVARVTARGVRLFGRVTEGKLRFGTVDRLLPPPTGKPFALPDLDVDVADAAVGIDTPIGRLGVAIEGKGNLSDGFDGKAAAVSSRLLVSGCAVDRPAAYLDVAVNERRPSVEGPVRAARVLCEKDDVDALQPVAILDADFAEDVHDWHGEGALRIASLRMGGNSASGLVGKLGFDGDGGLTRGNVTLGAAGMRMAGLRTGRTTIDGRYAYSAKGNSLSLLGDVATESLVGADSTIGPVVDALSGLDGTPLGPIGEGLAAAVSRAARSVNAAASIRLVNNRGGGAVRVEKLEARSRSGAELDLAGGDGITYYWPLGRMRMEGDFGLAGGGFPEIRASIVQPTADSPIRGMAQVQPMRAGAARLQLAPIRFSAGAGGATRVETAALIDGPLGDGRVAGLLVPIQGRIGGGGFAFGESCTPVSFRALQVAGLSLGPTRLPLCPTGRAILWRAAGGSMQGGAQVRALRLAGRLGDSPIRMTADRIAFGLAEPGFSGTNLAVRLGSGDSVQRLDVASLTGAFGAGGGRGAFAGAAGKLANVPLLLSDGAGRWSMAGGALAIDGSVTVSDEADPSRFYPLVSRDFRLTLADNVIKADGWLTDPETGTQVTEVAITHSLNTGVGNAILDVPGITFTEDYQPEQLTRLTVGVVALVRGTLRGEGEIHWDPEGSGSTGTFSTEDMDFAASFGPVNGLSTTIRFTDLLGLQTGPGQLAHVDEIQTGITVYDGDIRYQLLPDLKVKVESGHWPFAGGDLILEETILDFSKPSPKHLTFRVVGLDAAAFVQQFEFNNISATGTFDGVVPMVFDERGGRIVGGRLQARPDGGTLSYIGELTDKDLGAYGKLAFDALKSLRYDKLTISLDGALDGEFLTQVELDGIARNTANPGGIVGAVIKQLAALRFEFNITARGPFRALLATMRSLEDPSALIQSVLPEALQDLPTETTVQPEESETVQ